MRVSFGAIATATVFLTAPLFGQQLREDSYRWFAGAQAGVLLFETQTQTRTGIPSGGAHVLIMAKRAALQVSIDEAFGSADSSAFGDSSAPNGERRVGLDRLRKYSVTLMAFPLRGKSVDPFLGVGFGILHTVGTGVEGVFTSPSEASLAHSEAIERGSTGFGSLVAGIQTKLTPTLVLFGQYQITTSPTQGSLLVGPTNTFAAGVRFSLGGAKEGIRGGGY
jgi:hypothetical protein